MWPTQSWGSPASAVSRKVAAKRLGHLLPVVPDQSGYHTRRRRLADTIEWLMGMVAGISPGSTDDLLVIGSIPIECARSRETVTRSALGEAAGYGYCASHSRVFSGFRLHAIFAPTAPPGL